jgi:hypothetical protein
MENLENFVHLEFSFEKGKFELTQEHLNQLGSSIFDLYNSPVVLVKAYYPAMGNTSHNKGLVLKRLEQIKRFLDEEAIPNDIVIMEALGDFKPVDLVMSYLVENGLTSKKKDIDTVIMNRDGYRICLYRRSMTGQNIRIIWGYLLELKRRGFVLPDLSTCNLSRLNRVIDDWHAEKRLGGRNRKLPKSDIEPFELELENEHINSIDQSKKKEHSTH